MNIRGRSRNSPTPTCQRIERPRRYPLQSTEALMSAYLNDLIKEVEAEAEKSREQLKKLEALAPKVNRRSQEQDTGALSRILQRLEILKALAERDRKRS